MNEAAPKRRLQPWVATAAERELERERERELDHRRLSIRLVTIGFWRGGRDRPELDTHLPDPRSMIDVGWSAAERATVVAYLRAAPIVANYMGPSMCRICGCPNGGGEQSDGEYLWPTGFAHYVEAHFVRPPAAFIDHVITWCSSTH